MCNMLKLVPKSLRCLHTEMGSRTVCRVRRNRVNGRRAWELEKSTYTGAPLTQNRGEPWVPVAGHPGSRPKLTLH